MKRSLVPFLLAGMLGAAAPVRAAIPTPTGTLTVLSRPPGAAFQIQGVVEISGRTPVTLTPRVTGRYELRSTEPGFNTWRRVLNFDGVSPDTVWMTLSRKSMVGAGLRSAVVPGWGQFYSAHPASGAGFLGAAVLAGAGFGLSMLRYQDRQDAVDEAFARLNASSTPAQISAARASLQGAETERDDALRMRRIAGGVVGGVWAISFIETLARFPKASNRLVSLELAPAGLDTHTPVVAALRVRF
jgi:hypothetical protein